MRKILALALCLFLTSCKSPTNPWEGICHDVMIGWLSEITDSLTAEGWVVLPGDTIAVREGDCPEEDAPNLILRYDGLNET